MNALRDLTAARARLLVLATSIIDGHARGGDDV